MSLELEISIIRATILQVNDMGEVHSQAWKQAYSDIVPKEYLQSITREGYSEAFRENLKKPNMEYYLIYMNNKPIGMMQISYSNDSTLGEVNSIYLLKNHCGKGLGSICLKFAIKQLIERNCKQVYLWVLEDNKIARRFYEKMGFVSSGEKREIYRGRQLIQQKYSLQRK